MSTKQNKNQTKTNNKVKVSNQVPTQSKTPRRKRNRNKKKKQAKMDFSAQAIDLPRNEQLMLKGIVNKDHSRTSRQYLKTLVLPQYCMSRIPDSFLGSTALIHSVTVVDIPVYNDSVNPSNTGRFAAIVNPTLGTLNSATLFKVAMVNANPTFPVDLSLPASFVALSNGKDIRLDTFYTTLTQPPLSCLWGTNNAAGGVTLAKPFGNALNFFGGYGLAINYNAVSNIITMPAGLYKLDLLFSTTIAVNNNTSVNVLINGSSNNVTNIYSVFGTVATGNDLSSAWSGLINMSRTSNLVVTLTGAAGAVLDDSFISLAPVFDDQPNTFVSADGGIVSKMRPVACSALCTYTGPPLTGGGNIATAFLPGGASTNQFFNNSTGVNMGSLSAWQNVAALKGSYDGKLTEGSYTWWAPEGLNDYLLRTPNEMNGFDYPDIVIAGQYAPGAVFTNGQVIARLEVHTVYEFVTDSLLFESKHQAGSQAIMDGVLNKLAGEPHCMQNSQHLDFAKRVASGAKNALNFANNNKELIGKGLDLIGSFL